MKILQSNASVRGVCYTNIDIDGGPEQLKVAPDKLKGDLELWQEVT